MDEMSLVYRGQMPNLFCCDTMLRVMPNGEWLCLFLSGGYREPQPDNSVYGCRSTDRGKSWSSPELLISNSPALATVPSEVMVVDGRVTVFLSTHDSNYEWTNWESWYSVSDDSGYTWSKMHPVPHHGERTFVRNALWTRGGDLVLPWAWNRGDCLANYEDSADKLVATGSPGSDPMTYNGAFVSHDRGATFECSDPIESPGDTPESNVAELADSTLVMLIRADGTGVLYRSDSVDGGLTWCAAYPTDIPNPGSKFRLHVLSDGRVLLVHNPSNDPEVRWPLSLWISNDDMKSWAYQRDVVTFPGQLAYPDGFVDEGEEYLHFVFDYNRHDVIYVGARLPK